MSTIRQIEGELSASGTRFAIVAARFNGFIVERLLEGALETLSRHGAEPERIEVVRVPGAFEIPLVLKLMAAAGRHDAFIALGAVVRGGTPHFEYVAGECARGLARTMYDFGVPVAFGVLTVDTVEQAVERAGAHGDNKGAEAALTAIEMASLARQLRA
jgi:6,7-dimethyl-8-ribityllumazine synthase